MDAFRYIFIFNWEIDLDSNVSNLCKVIARIYINWCILIGYLLKYDFPETCLVEVHGTHERMNTFTFIWIYKSTN